MRSLLPDGGPLSDRHISCLSGYRICHRRHWFYIYIYKHQSSLTVSIAFKLKWWECPGLRIGVIDFIFNPTWHNAFFTYSKMNWCFTNVIIFRWNYRMFFLYFNIINIVYFSELYTDHDTHKMVWYKRQISRHVLYQSKYTCTYIPLSTSLWTIDNICIHNT